MKDKQDYEELSISLDIEGTSYHERDNVPAYVLLTHRQQQGPKENRQAPMELYLISNTFQ